MDIKKENLVKAYSKADENVKQLLRELFPEAGLETAHAADKRPVTERIKTFEDACKELGEKNPLVEQYNYIEPAYRGEPEAENLLAYMKLCIVCAALNEGWEPQFTEDEIRYYPWHLLYTQEEIDEKHEEEKTNRHMMSTGDYQTEYADFAYANSTYAPSNTNASVGSRLCLKSDTLAVYCGKQFIKLWADFKLIRK